MTAYIVVVQPGAAHLISDAAGVEHDGVVKFIVSKPTLFPDLSLVVAVTGYVEPDWLQEEMVAAAPADQADAIKSLPLIAHAIAGRNKASHSCAADVVLTAISWHPVAGAAAWTCATGACAARRGWKPWQVHRVRALLEDIADHAAVLGRPVDLFDPASFDPARDGLALMEDCRSRPADAELWDGRTDHYGIGGFAELTSVGPNGIEQHRLRTWAEDRVGKRIRPLAAPRTKAA